jgi:hypothetical protein
MEKELLDMGYNVKVSENPDSKADINHHINYAAYEDCPTVNTTMVTHFTSDMQSMEQKLDKMRQIAKNGVGICFSEGIKEYLIKEGIPKNKLEVVLPAHDSIPRRPRLIAIAFKVYPDGRKREEMLGKMFRTLKDPNNFIFRIMGPGWKDTLDGLTKEGMVVYWQPEFSADTYRALLESSDYMLYTGGEDAVAQCIVDSAQAGLRIIAPSQRDIKIDIPFNTQEELNKIFQEMEKNPVENWTWTNYTKQHIKIWEKLYKQKK